MIIQSLIKYGGRLGFGLGLLLFTQALTFAIRGGWPEKIVVNQGVIFGIWVQPAVVIGVIVLGLGLLGQMVRAERLNQKNGFAITLIIVGAISNILDRLFYGGVIDYLKFGHWTTFSLADVEIMAGILMLIGLFSRRQSND